MAEEPSETPKNPDVDLLLLKAERDGIASLLLDVQQECIALRAELGMKIRQVGALQRWSSDAVERELRKWGCE